MANEIYYIGANDEHGINPPTAGKRTPTMPNLDRSIYENEFNRAAKIYFIEALFRNGFSVYDVKPELRDISINERVRRVNRQNLTALVTFAYNAYGEVFNSASGVGTYYSPLNPQSTQSRQLAENIYGELVQGTPQRPRGVNQLDIGILSSVNCPSALVEAGFMTNLQEARRMINPLFQIEVGEESCQGVCQYLGVDFIPRDIRYPVLRNGSRSNYVFLLQFILNQNGANLTVDGVFGNRTAEAVRNFQENNSLAVDGIVGTNTWRTLLTMAPYPILRNGSRGVYVTFLQQLLESNLIPVGNIDGIFGNQTETAVRQFQENNNLSVDGIVGPITWRSLAQID